jgi:hypothetical protein
MKGTRKRNAVMLISNAKGPLFLKLRGPVPAVDGLYVRMCVSHTALHSYTFHSV